MRILSRAVIFFFSLSIIACQGISASDIEKVDINSAPLKDLIKIIHIGEGKTEELISLRSFSPLDDLTRIKCINEKRIDDIKKQGLAWVNPVEAETKTPLQNESQKPGLESQPVSQLESPTYPSGIVINEILPNTPLNVKDEEGEYIELFNQNNFEVNLSGWKIEDTAGRKTTYTLPQKTKISAQKFLILYRPTTKITLNNEGDGLNLIKPDGKILDSVSYKKAPQGQSYNRTPSGWAWSTILTPAKPNILTSKPELTDISGKKRENPIPQSEEKNPKKELAAIGEQSPKSPGFLFIFLIALILAILSGIIILTLKNKLKMNYNKNKM